MMMIGQCVRVGGAGQSEALCVAGFKLDAVDMCEGSQSDAVPAVNPHIADPEQLHKEKICRYSCGNQAFRFKHRFVQIYH